MNIQDNYNNNKDEIISICITSYNRVNELKRLLNSIKSSKFVQNIEIIISEDHSPKRQDIEQVVKAFDRISPFKVIFNANERNLGYDRNLGKLISLSQGKFIIFISDDDSFNSSTLDLYISHLIRNDCNLAYQPFIIPDNNLKRFYHKSFYIEPSEYNVGKYINDAILFSGLTFKRSLISNIDSDIFLNTNYFQVYLFMEVLYNHGAHYVNIPLINCHGDGENGYGISESSIKDENLVNRQSIFSNITFHIGLIKVVKSFDAKNQTHIINSFEKEYSIRSSGGLILARKSGLNDYYQYINKIETLDLNLTYIYFLFKYMILILGSKLSQKILSIPKKILLSFRKYYY